MKLFLPKQHGAWAMLIIPFWLGVFASSFIWQHIPFFIGWMFLYLATYPMLFLFKKKNQAFYLKWTFIYLLPAVILLLIPLWVEPKIVYFALMMVPFFVINAYYSKHNNERALLNDFSAIFAFSIVTLATAYLSAGTTSELVIIAFISSILFFVGCTFYVKSMIREKKNMKYKYISWGFHLLMVILWMLLGKWYIAIAFVSSLVRAVYLYGKPIKIMTLGIIEIINAAWFFIWMVVAIIFY